MRERLLLSAEAFTWNLLRVEISDPNIVELVPPLFAIFKPRTFLLFDVRVVVSALCGARVNNSAHKLILVVLFGVLQRNLVIVNLLLFCFTRLDFLLSLLLSLFLLVQVLLSVWTDIYFILEFKVVV